MKERRRKRKRKRAHPHTSLTVVKLGKKIPGLDLFFLLLLFLRLLLSQQPLWHPVAVTIETLLGNVCERDTERKEKLKLFPLPCLLLSSCCVLSSSLRSSFPSLFSLNSCPALSLPTHSVAFVMLHAHLSGRRQPAVARQRAEVESNFTVKETCDIYHKQRLFCCCIRFCSQLAD